MERFEAPLPETLVQELIDLWQAIPELGPDERWRRELLRLDPSPNRHPHPGAQWGVTRGVPRRLVQGGRTGSRVQGRALAAQSAWHRDGGLLLRRFRV